MLIELKKGYWVSCDKCLLDEGFVGCGDMECYDNNDICCEECIFNDVVKLPLEEVNTKEEDLQKLFIDCNKDELEEIKCLLRDKGYNVI